MSTVRGAAALLDSVGLLADGPVLWGRPVPARGPGVYVVELASPLPRAPIELTRVGKWVERVPDLNLDGARPSSRALAARLAEFWLPGTPIVYIGMSANSLAARVAAMERHVLGDRRPHAGSQWLHALTGLERARIWWAAVEAAEEYEDALFGAFAALVTSDERSHLPDRTVVLPFANLQSATGERKAHGITGAVLPDPDAGVVPATRVVELPDGDAVGTSREAKGSGTIRRRGTPASLGQKARTPARARWSPESAAASAPAGRTSDRAAPVDMTADALERMHTELRELTHVKRQDVVARVKAARELGDLRENAEYHAAREEHSFLEGRVRTLEDRIRNARVFESSGTPHVGLGSTVTVEHDGESETYTIVGSTEADPAGGRISAVSPVGAALVGHMVGDVVVVKTPRGAASYRVTGLS